VKISSASTSTRAASTSTSSSKSASAAYLSSSSSLSARKRERAGPRLRPRPSLVQATMLWSAGAVDIQDYETAVRQFQVSLKMRASGPVADEGGKQGRQGVSEMK
jgi:hypothetical protein